jgi:hypothetical protein
MSPVGFEPTIPVFERAKTFHALDNAATVMFFQFHSLYYERIKYGVSDGKIVVFNIAYFIRASIVHPLKHGVHVNIIYKSSFYLKENTLYSRYKNRWLISLSVMVNNCSEKGKKHINTLCGQNTGFFNIKLGGAYLHNQWSLKA